MRAENIKISKTLINQQQHMESWALNEDIAKWLAASEENILRRMFGGIKVNEDWRKQYNKDLIQLFGD